MLFRSAYENGFTPFSTGCHVIIGDGLKGTDEELVPINGEYVKEAKIGRAVMDADVFISLTHFKGHEMAGFGGALKNIGMGCGSRAGKMEMHSEGKPYVNQENCIGCGMCTKVCAHTGITVTDKKASINHDNCVGCGRCIGVCPKDAVEPSFGESNDICKGNSHEHAHHERLEVSQSADCLSYSSSYHLCVRKHELAHATSNYCHDQWQQKHSITAQFWCQKLHQECRKENSQCNNYIS